MDASVIAAIQERFPGLVPEDGWPAEGVLVPVESHLDFAQFLKEDLGFTLYVTVVGSHWPGEAKEDEEPAEDVFEVATVLRRPVANSTTIHWRVKLSSQPVIPSLFSVFAGADWQEREQFDLVGIVFENHPDMRRLMMPEDWEGYPLRKDYAIDTAHAPWR